MNTTWSKPTRYIAGVGLGLLVIFILYISRSVIPLLLLAALIAALLRPVINWMGKKTKLTRGVTVILVYLLALILSPLFLLVTVPIIIDTIEFLASLDFPVIFENTRNWILHSLVALKNAPMPLESLDTYIDGIVVSLLDILEGAGVGAASDVPSLDTLFQSLGTALAGTFGVASSVVGSLVTQVTSLILMYLISVYISLGAHTYKNTFLNAIPQAYRPEIETLIDRIMRTWSRYFRGEVTLMILIGLMSWVGLTALGIPGAPYLAVIAGLLELIPNLGPVLATIPAVIVALFQGSSYIPLNNLVMAGIVLLLYVVIQQIENNIIVPRVLGDAVGLPALVVLVGVVIGTTVAGILGAVLVTPVIASSLEITRYVYRKMLVMPPFPAEPKQSDRMPGPLPAWMGFVGKWLQKLWDKVRQWAKAVTKKFSKREINAESSASNTVEGGGEDTQGDQPLG